VKGSIDCSMPTQQRLVSIAAEEWVSEKDGRRPWMTDDNKLLLSEAGILRGSAPWKILHSIAIMVEPKLQAAGEIEGDQWKPPIEQCPLQHRLDPDA
jgi:hypothetical protein